jgi:hypothetical protein
MSAFAPDLVIIGPRSGPSLAPSTPQLLSNCLTGNTGALKLAALGLRLRGVTSFLEAGATANSGHLVYYALNPQLVAHLAVVIGAGRQDGCPPTRSAPGLPWCNPCEMKV